MLLMAFCVGEVDCVLLVVDGMRTATFVMLIISSKKSRTADICYCCVHMTLQRMGSGSLWAVGISFVHINLCMMTCLSTNHTQRVLGDGWLIRISE